MEDIDAILITGPTASGKSAIAIRLAKAYNGAVVNADSMQVYDTLRILTARPAEDEMEGISHHLYGHVPATRAYSTGEWLRDVQGLLAEIRARGQVPIVVGGTGLYFKALTGGLSDMPEIPQSIRCDLRLRLKQEGADTLHAELARRDAAIAAQLEPSDGQRVVRALEVFEATGRSILDFQSRKGPMIIDPAKAGKFVVLPDRAVLRERINRRFENMFDQGAVAEVEALLKQDPSDDMPVMKAIGVREIADMLAGRLSEADVVERSSALTRQYAKRQMTWFRNQMDDSWRRVSGAEATL